MAEERVCWLCLEDLDFEVSDMRNPEFVVIDEEIPVSKGGFCEDISNCHLVHRRCNAKKGSKILPKGAFASDEKRVEHGIPPLGRVAILHKPKTSRKWI